MTVSRLIGYSLYGALTLLAGCNKETSSPPPPAPSSAPAPAPAPAPPTASAPPASSAAPAAAGATSDQAGREIASKSGCFACHAADKKLVGPAYKEVADKYRGQADAQAKLMQKVKNGGAGVWGQVPMPPNPQLSDQDLKTVVDWVLSAQ